MNLTTTERQQLETALDELMIALESPSDQMARFRAMRSYSHAIKVVRERPADVRRMRSDSGTRRVPRGQQQLPV